MNGKCLKCGHSCGGGSSYGGNCRQRIMRAALSLKASKNVAAGKAAELLMYPEGRIRRLGNGRGRCGTFAVRSGAKGSNISYIVTEDVCSCPAGQNEKMCYHRVAVTILGEV